ncbi:ABC-2 type transport system permease protein [Fontibacillus panacisegetis]|uniref:ABC-2 type transport system permease protein n=1 Tax=Fontibacillus panacisegetis TaxID=670482 RepID=A0A1G7GSJ9_9BACL|nr:ABC transporter permease [Fontibacillus panacisegetis]SDE90929.1 ABC-2 type transport system permease protein [Fontibacillus panacisegetis]
MKFINLVKNEHMKLYQQRSSILSLLIVYACTALAVIGQRWGNSWPFSTYWDSVSYALQIFTQLFMLISIIISIHMISREYSAGTIKLLLIRPLSRSSILLSKYITILLYALLGILGSIPLTMTLAGIISGFEGWNQMEGLPVMIKLFVMKLFIFPFYIALAFMVTILTRHQGLSLLITILFFSITVSFVPVIPGMSTSVTFLSWSLLNAAFLIIGWRAFQRQEV